MDLNDYIFAAAVHKFRCILATVNLAYQVLPYLISMHVQVINKDNMISLFCQCVREGWKDKLQEQKNEGCAVTGHLEVNKVCHEIQCMPKIQNKMF